MQTPYFTRSRNNVPYIKEEFVDPNREIKHHQSNYHRQPQSQQPQSQQPQSQQLQSQQQQRSNGTVVYRDRQIYKFCPNISNPWHDCNGYCLQRYRHLA